MRHSFQQHQSNSRATSQERDTRFGGYGDRVGSGVELAPTHWRGGELVTDPTLVNKVLNGIRPKKFFYSPIGDGVVAADGVEMKRGPVDLTPKVEVIHQRVVEKGDAGQGGVRVTEKAWSSGGGPGDNSALSQSAYSTNAPTPAPVGDITRSTPAPVAASQNASAAPTPTPYSAPASELLASLNATPTPSAAPAPAPAPSAPTHSYAAPVSSLPSSAYNTLASAPATEPAYNPYGTYGSQRSSAPYDTLNSKADPYGSRAGSVLDYPRSASRASTVATTADLFSEPGYRYEIKKDYQVTNPRELIHQFATSTPIQTIPGYEKELADGGITTHIIKKSYSSATEETFGPYPPYGAGPNSVNPNKFVRQLRDETMTVTQRQANQNLNPLNPRDANYSQKLDQIRRQTQSTAPNNEIDQLTNRLVAGLHTGKY